MHWRCRLGLHKKEYRQDDEALRTWLCTGVAISYCKYCPWYQKGIHE